MLATKDAVLKVVIDVRRLQCWGAAQAQAIPTTAWRAGSNAEELVGRGGLWARQG